MSIAESTSYKSCNVKTKLSLSLGGDSSRKYALHLTISQYRSLRIISTKAISSPPPLLPSPCLPCELDVLDGCKQRHKQHTIINC